VTGPLPSSSLDSLFRPQVACVIGASQHPEKIGHIVFQYLRESQVRTYPVNPSVSEIDGVRCYASVKEIPARVDLAVITLPAPAVPEAIRECAAAGVRAAIPVSGGFAETGPAGAALERQVKETASQAGMRVLGPNTLGVLVPASGLDTMFVVKERCQRPPAGSIAFISQSGATGVTVMDAQAYYGVGFSAFVGLGNKVDINENELCDYFGDDPATSVLAFYLEDFADGRGFMEAVRRVIRKKPVVMLKAGRSAAGARAASSHTGALAGEDRVTDGVLRQLGVHRVYDEEELVDAARALAYVPPAPGRRVAVVTTAGGHGVILADEIAATVHGFGLEMATLGPDTIARLRSETLPIASVRNPVDITASGSTTMMTAAVDALLDDPAVDAIICGVLLQTPYIDATLVDELAKRARAASKPIVAYVIGGAVGHEMLRRLEALHVPAYQGTWRAARAVAALVERGEFLRRQEAARPPAGPARPVDLPGRALAEHEVKDLLASYGVVSPARMVIPPGQELPAALVPGGPVPFPVVLKVSDASITHKTEAKAVRLHLATRAELASSFAEFRERFPDKSLLVESMAPAGLEMIVGAVVDRTFGPSLMVGMGGFWAELYQDVAFRALPVDAGDVRDMLASLAGRKVFSGYRGLQVDVDALVEAVMGIGQLAMDIGDRLVTLDVNPLLVAPHGVMALDAKLVTR